MLKTLGPILLAFLLLIMFNTPVRNFMNSLLQKDRAELREEQIIGRVSVYNPRVEEIQQILKDAGLEPGVIDGEMGGQTRSAIKEFQKRKGLKLTGKIDSKTWLELQKEKEVMGKADDASSEKSLSLISNTELSQKSEYMKAEDAVTKKKADIQDEIMSYRLKSKSRTKQIQMALKNIGFYKGDIDGKLGPQTKRAIKTFQKSKGLTPDGIVGTRTWEELIKYLKD